MSKINDEYDYQVLNLTEQFYNDYPNPPYKEIIRKGSRPYNCLLIQSKYNYFICIPYRSHINHKYSYRFKNSLRSQKAKSGLDYTKIVIIQNNNYLGALNAIIDSDEYKETRDNIEIIKNDAQKYIDNYVKYISSKFNDCSKREFIRIYGFSTLKYFHNELNLKVE